MKIFKVSRADSSWCEDFEIIVVAIDKKHAERKARWSSEDFKKGKVTTEEIDISEEKVIATRNRGA